jgi:hypothetical protein
LGGGKIFACHVGSGRQTQTVTTKNLFFETANTLMALHATLIIDVVRFTL